MEKEKELLNVGDSLKNQGNSLISNMTPWIHSLEWALCNPRRGPCREFNGIEDPSNSGISSPKSFRYGFSVPRKWRLSLLENV